MTVWRIGCRWSDSGGAETAIYDIFFREEIVFVNVKWMKILEVQPGDIFSLTSGANIVAVGKVKSSAKSLTDLHYTVNDAQRFKSDINKNFSIDEIGLDSKIALKVEIYDVRDKNKSYSNHRNPGAICKDNKYCATILELYETMKKEKQMEDYIKLLKNAKNLILTGAPGTGKTYLARNIAAKIMFNKDRFNDLDDDQKQMVGYVQFHSSYDYTDFVEGLRPVSNNEGSTDSIGFKRQDGIFKEFCRRVITNKQDDNFDEAWDVFIEKLNSNKDANGSLKTMELTFSNSKKKKIGLQPKNPSGIAEYSDDVNYSNKIVLNNRYISKEQVYNVYKGNLCFRSAEKYKRLQKDREDIVSFLKRECGLKDYTQVKDDVQDYVFIIDEINRGEVSKIFGELFNAIDPDYRGKAGRITTQYQNLNEGDEFAKGFYVPDNVYIIGTMNDIDRSVESMDFAFRRRFAWEEIKACDDMLDGNIDSSILEDAKNRMNSLNRAIWDKDTKKGIDGLSSAYHIGASYFLKLNTYKDDADKGFASLWKYHIKPLLQEYLRGMDDVDKKLEILENAYNSIP